MLVLNTVVILISDTFKLARKALDIKNKHTTKCLQNLHLFRCLFHVFSDKFKRIENRYIRTVLKTLEDLPHEKQAKKNLRGRQRQLASSGSWEIRVQCRGVP